MFKNIKNNLKDIHNDAEEISKEYKDTIAPKWLSYSFFYIFLLFCFIMTKIFGNKND